MRELDTPTTLTLLASVGLIMSLSGAMVIRSGVTELGMAQILLAGIAVGWSFGRFTMVLEI